MGKFSELVLQKLSELKAIQGEKPPVFEDDPVAGSAYIQRQVDADYMRNTLGSRLTEIVKRLPPKERQRFFFQCEREDKETHIGLVEFSEFLSKDRDVSDWILNPSKFGVSAEDTVQNLEALAKANGIDLDAEAEELVKVYPLSDYRVPLERRVERPYQSRIDQLRKQIHTGDPDAKRKRSVLSRAEKILTDATTEYLNYLQKKVSGLGKERLDGLDEQVERTMQINIERYLAQEEGGRYKEKLPHVPSVTGRRLYDMLFADPSANQLTEEDIAAMRSRPSPFSSDLKERVLKVSNTMDAIGERFYYNSEAYHTVEGTEEKPIYSMYVPEQSQKMYAFIPLIAIKERVASSLDDDDGLMALEIACDAYDDCKKQMDQIVKTTEKGWAPLYGSNLESTRSLNPPSKNRLPVEYAENFVPVCRANGIQLLYGFTKNNEISMKELLDDPVGTIEKSGKNYVENRGLNADGSLGAKLFRALCRNSAEHYDVNWKKNGMLLTRGIPAVTAMAADRDEAAAVEIAVQMGGTLATMAVKKDFQLWDKLLDANEERKNALYRCVGLLPEQEIDMRSLADLVTSPNYRETTDVTTIVSRLRKEGKLDLSELAKRTDRILSQFEAEKSRNPNYYKSVFDAEAYRAELFKVYSYMLKSATPEERRSPGFKQLKAVVGRVNEAEWREALKEKKAKTTIGKLNEKINVLNKKKEGAFLSSTNSKEHQRMTKALDRVRYKLRLMQGEELSELSEGDRKKLEKMDLADEVRKARYATYEYYRIKEKNGTKSSYVHDVGVERSEAARDTIEALDNLADKLGLRNPAERQLDEDQMLLLENRQDKDWMRKNGGKCLARMVYCMSVHFKGHPVEKEAALLSEQALSGKVDRICQNSKSFQRMMDKNGLDKLAEAAIEGGGRLTNAYMKAANVERQPKERIKPEKLNLEQKETLWQKQNVLP